MTGHAGQVRAVVTGTGSLEIKWPLNPPTTSRRGGRDSPGSLERRDSPDQAFGIPKERLRPSRQRLPRRPRGSPFTTNKALSSLHARTSQLRISREQRIFGGEFFLRFAWLRPPPSLYYGHHGGYAVAAAERRRLRGVYKTY